MYIIQKTLYGCNYFLDKDFKWTGLRENAEPMVPAKAVSKAKALHRKFPYEQVTVKTNKK